MASILESSYDKQVRILIDDISALLSDSLPDSAPRISVTNPDNIPKFQIVASYMDRGIQRFLGCSCDFRTTTGTAKLDSLRLYPQKDQPYAITETFSDLVNDAYGITPSLTRF